MTNKNGHNFEENDYVLLVDSKERSKIVQIKKDQQIQSHAGVLDVNDILNKPVGSTAITSKGQKLLLLRPTLEEQIILMKRGAQIIYPKDFGAIISMGDIFPGAKVLESGVGSGSLSIALLQAVGSTGSITGYELREDFALVSRKNIDEHSIYNKNYSIEINNIYEGINIAEGESKFDRLVLDLPEPWNVIPHFKSGLINGAVVTSYVPTVLQAHKFCDALDDAGYTIRQTREIIERGWYFSKTSARPDHRMVAHTGFITSVKIHY